MRPLASRVELAGPSGVPEGVEMSLWLDLLLLEVFFLHTDSHTQSWGGRPSGQFSHLGLMCWWLQAEPPAFQTTKCY